MADSWLSFGLSKVALIPVGVLSLQSLSNAIKAPLPSRSSSVGSCNGCAIPKLPSVGPIARSTITGGSPLPIINPPMRTFSPVPTKPRVLRLLKIEVVLSNSFGFGGTNASLIFRRLPA